MRACWLLLLVLVAGGALADEASPAAAEQAMASGDYRQAIRTYEQVIARHGFSAPVLFNLGNAWLRLGRPGRAILAYERALVLAPGNAVIESNLAAARQRAGISPPAVSPWLAGARYFGFDTYMWVGLVAIWTLCAAAVLLCLRGPPRRLARPLMVTAALLLCVSADAAVVRWSDLYRAVVLSPATLHLAPAQSAAASGSIREGEVVWLQRRYAGFNLVRTADGHAGWVSDDVAVPIRIRKP
ncbi:MAG TPA: tetratricopeptide repeat protein [Steroidobacteraceae bacterium]|nr:tetratricopeptide repeat protein [Steroidobacteraceae bacterium]